MHALAPGIKDIEEKVIVRSFLSLWIIATVEAKIAELELKITNQRVQIDLRRTALHVTEELDKRLILLEKMMEQLTSNVNKGDDHRSATLETRMLGSIAQSSGQGPKTRRTL